MNTLPTILRKNGFMYTQLLAGEKSFLYRQEYTNEVKYYEVFKKVIAKETTIHGKIIPEHISFPGNEDFGNWAWSFRDHQKAIAEFNRIEALT